MDAYLDNGRDEFYQEIRNLEQGREEVFQKVDKKSFDVGTIMILKLTREKAVNIEVIDESQLGLS